VCLAIGFFSVVQRGAFWFIAEDEVINCKKYWWSNLLLVNNLFTVTDIVSLSSSSSSLFLLISLIVVFFVVILSGVYVYVCVDVQDSRFKIQDSR